MTSYHYNAYHISFHLFVLPFPILPCPVLPSNPGANCVYEPCLIQMQEDYDEAELVVSLLYRRFMEAGAARCEAPRPPLAGAIDIWWLCSRISRAIAGPTLCVCCGCGRLKLGLWTIRGIHVDAVRRKLRVKGTPRVTGTKHKNNTPLGKQKLNTRGVVSREEGLEVLRS